MSGIRVMKGSLLALCLAASTALAQTRAADRLSGRLDAATLAAVRAQLDSAARSGVPTEPLVQRALLGATRRAASARIVQAVRELRAELGVARGALGGASEAELVAAAGAVHGGASAGALRQIDAARGPRNERALTVALATLTDLVAIGVPVDTAAATVLALVQRGAADDEIVAVREGVEADVSAGAEPAAAARARSGRARGGRDAGEARGNAGGRGAAARGGPPGPDRGPGAASQGQGRGRGAPPNVPRRPDREKKPKP